MRDRPSLRRRAQLEGPTNIEDGYGGVQPGWTRLTDHWVALQPVSGAESYEGSRETPVITHRILLRCPRRFRPRANQRFTIADRVFHIRAVFDRDGRGRYLTCLVEEKTNP